MYTTNAHFTLKASIKILAKNWKLLILDMVVECTWAKNTTKRLFFIVNDLTHQYHNIIILRTPENIYRQMDCKERERGKPADVVRRNA